MATVVLDDQNCQREQESTDRGTASLPQRTSLQHCDGSCLNKHKQAQITQETCLEDSIFNNSSQFVCFYANTTNTNTIETLAFKKLITRRLKIYPSQIKVRCK